MKIKKAISQVFSKAILFLKGGSTISHEDELFEVVRVLDLYRFLRDMSKSIIIESFQPLSELDKMMIREFLRVSDDVKIVERTNPALVGSFQLIYKGNVYSYQNGHRLRQLKEAFIYS